ncbi:MAG TPA: hypothetical protein VF629_14855 [Hymenobacter sp.]|uniref:hypothetical protein n=1 Tax=Hymenobacter sp. TaxID=1898978 RepID=UPI002ED8F749
MHTISLLLLLPAAAVAQDQKPELPYNANLVIKQPEVGAGNPAFTPSPEVRGMKALADGKVYWVSTDGQSLMAYQANRMVWKADVVAACPAVVGERKIHKVVLGSNTVFVRVGDRTFAEVNTVTGKITPANVQKD